MTAVDAPSGPVPPSGAPVVLRIQALLDDLAPAERRVAAHVLDDLPATAASSITNLARGCAVSETTVVRFCRRLGLRGYRDLRTALVTAAALGQEPQERPGGDIAVDDDLASVVRALGAAEEQALAQTVAQLDVEELGRVVDAVVAAGRVQLVGIGASGLVAQDLQAKLHRIGLTALAATDAHAALTGAALLAPDDVLIAISHSSETHDAVDPLGEARRQGATTVAITNARRSRLAAAAQLVLTTASRETDFRSGATSSRIAQLLIVDCVFVGVAQRTYDTARDGLDRTRRALAGRRPASPRRQAPSP